MHVEKSPGQGRWRTVNLARPAHKRVIEPCCLVGVERRNQPGRGDSVERGRKAGVGRTSALIHILGSI